MVTKHTFHDIHQWPFFDDAAVFAILHWVHTIHNLLDMRQLQVLHKVIVKDGLLYEILGPFGFGELPECLSEVVEGPVGLRLGRDALCPGGPGADVGRGHGQHWLAFMEFPLQLLDFFLLLWQPLLQLFDPLLLEHENLGKVFLQLAHVFPWAPPRNFFSGDGGWDYSRARRERTERVNGR